MAADARARLARAEHDVLAALLEARPAPAGFDAKRFRIAAQALRHKRARSERRRAQQSASSPRFSEPAGNALSQAWRRGQRWLESLLRRA